MSHVIALELEAGPPALAELSERVLDLAECVGEDSVVRAEDVIALPRLLPGVVAVRGAREHEVHRAHVERGKLWFYPQRRSESLLDRHVRAAAGGDVDNGVCLRGDQREELEEDLRVTCGGPAPRIASVEMQDRRSGRGRLDRCLGDLR